MVVMCEKLGPGDVLIRDLIVTLPSAIDKANATRSALRSMTKLKYIRVV